MKIVRYFLALSVLWTSGVEAQTKSVAMPPGAMIDTYPILDTGGKPLSVEVYTRLGLKPCVLREDWTGFNWYSTYQGVESNRFWYETLSAGTEALCDAEGVPRYKTDCGNRLVAIPQCELCDAETRLDLSSLLKLDVSGEVTHNHFFPDTLTVRVVGLSDISEAQRKPSWLGRYLRWVVAGASALVVGEVVACKVDSRLCLFSNTNIIIVH